MDMRMVQKFGGTSLADPAALRRAAELTAQAWTEGHRVAVVVSAQGDTTDELIEKAMLLTTKPAPRELDMLLCAGEQMSAALFAMELTRRGIPAVSLTGAQAGIHTTSRYGSAEILDISPQRVCALLEQGTVPVVAGFQGADAQGDLTTLGRGGSDTTAVALAAALKADLCRIYTDVDGVYDRDPRRFPDAHRFASIGYDEMLALAERGAQVLHPRCVQLARDHHIPLEVRSTFTDTPGTRVDTNKF